MKKDQEDTEIFIKKLLEEKKINEMKEKEKQIKLENELKKQKEKLIKKEIDLEQLAKNKMIQDQAKIDTLTNLTKQMERLALENNRLKRAFRNNNQNNCTIGRTLDKICR